jgi:DNA-nicking Smr family endonuclease
MPGRRPRRLTAAERTLWCTVARTVTRPGDPLPIEPAAEEAPEGAAVPCPLVPKPQPVESAPAKPLHDEPRVSIDLAPDPLAASLAPPHGLGGRRRLARLARGKLKPEGRLDLHGMTQDAAHAALVSFIRSARAQGLRHVLVITGKGRPDRSDAVVPQRQGVLRQSLPRWLAAPPLAGQVVDMRQAHARHGGTGAVYLFLRRKG